MELLENEYHTLETFMRTVLWRVQTGQMNAHAAHRDVMHVLEAWDHGNRTTFAPLMRSKLSHWSGQDA